MLPRVIFVLAAVGVTIYSVIDCLRSDDAEIRGLPKPLWLVVIILAPLLGGILWLVFGHQPTPGRPGGGRRLRTIGPDDDPDFLRSIKPPPTPRRRKNKDDDEEPKL